MFNKILVAVDLDHDAEIDNLLNVTSQIAKARASEVKVSDVYLINVISAAQPVVSQFLPESYEKMAFSKIEKQLTNRTADIDLPGGITDISVRFGDVYQEILTYAEKIEADLIIVASHKPNVSDYLLGSTASRIVRHASCSTLVVRQTERT